MIGLGYTPALIARVLVVVAGALAAAGLAWWLS